MNEGYVLLVEKEAMWAKMLAQVLKDNDIPCTTLPVYGAGVVMKTGKLECLKVYVPSDKLDQAKELLDELFSGDAALEE